MKTALLPILLLITACGIMPSENRIFDPEKEFAKLDGPDVPTVQQSLERAAIDSLVNRKYKNAISLYEQLMDMDTEMMRYKLGMAEALRRYGKDKPAIAFYSLVLNKEPGNIDALEGRALAKMSNGETEEAARELQQVLKRDERRWRTLNALGILFAVKDMPQEAMAYFDEALKYSNNNASVLNNVALTRAMQRDFSAAVRDFDRASANADGVQRMQIELNQSLVYGISGEMAKAEALASKHLSESALKNNMGLYAHLANDKELAKSYLNMALSGSKQFYERAWQNLDIIASEDKQPEESSGKRVKIR